MEHLYRLSAFPKGYPGGNPAGVYINADMLSEKEMQQIAYEVGYSETAFVLESDKADFKVRFFTPQNEVPLCGHATIATFNLLRDLKIIEPGIITQETKAGILKLDVREDIVYMQQPSPKFYEKISEEALHQCFEGLKLNNHFKPQIISTGLKEIFVAVDNINTLNNLIGKEDDMIELCKKHDAIGMHVFCLSDEVDAYGRNFAPVVGIFEESATGTSNGALAAYLYKYNKQKYEYVLRQGYSMNLPSEIQTKIVAEGNGIKEVWVGGSAQAIK